MAWRRSRAPVVIDGEIAVDIHRAEVVLDDSRLLLFLGERCLKVVVEVGPE
jgi:hypothetical protein